MNVRQKNHFIRPSNIYQPNEMKAINKNLYLPSGVRVLSTHVTSIGKFESSRRQGRDGPRVQSHVFNNLHSIANGNACWIKVYLVLCEIHCRVDVETTLVGRVSRVCMLALHPHPSVLN